MSTMTTVLGMRAPSGSLPRESRLAGDPRVQPVNDGPHDRLRSAADSAPVVLICAPNPLADELFDTLLWRTGVERHVASDVDGALLFAVAARPDLVVVDRNLPEAERLVSFIRHDPRLSRTAVAVLSHGARDAGEIGLIAAGADVVLRLPVTPDWDARLHRLLSSAAA
jgi:DNA-binding response OmpR family regulator